MHCVYTLETVKTPTHYYVGMTTDLERRLDEHNSGKSIHTNKRMPWKVSVSIGFEDKSMAYEFERYLKSGSGRAFAKRHF